MENTLPAFEAAAALDVAVQEFDVRQLRCGALVCVHDEDFDRTSDAAAVLGAGKPVRACTLDEVRRLDCGDGARVPTLEEALAVMLPGAYYTEFTDDDLGGGFDQPALGGRLLTTVEF